MRTCVIYLLLVFAIAAPLRAGSAEDQYLVAAAHYRRGRWQLAVDEFSTFLAEYPDDSRAASVVFFLGESFVQLGRFDQAGEHFKRYVDESPDGQYARRALFRIGESAYLSGDHDASRAPLREFHEKYSGDELEAYVLGYLGQAALEARELDKSRAWFEQCLKQFPVGPMADECRFGLARVLEVQGDVDGALRFYRFLGEKVDSPLRAEALLQETIVLYHQGQFQEAIETLRPQLEHFSGNKLAPHAWYWLGTSQMAAGQWKLAAGTLGEGAERFARHVLASAMHFSAGEAYRHEGDLKAARTHYQSVVQQFPESRWADDSLQTLVRIAWDNDSLEEVESLAEQFTGQFADSPLYWIVQQTRGRALIKRAQYEAAIEVLEPLAQQLATSRRGQTDKHATTTDDTAENDERVVVQPEEDSPGSRLDPANWYYLALAQLGAKRLPDALESLHHIRTVEQPPPLADGVKVARAAALVGLKRFDEAIEPLEAYLAARPEGLDAVKCRAQLAVACAHLQRWPDVQRVMVQMRKRKPASELYLPTVQYLAEAAYRQQRRTMAKRYFHELSRESNPPAYVAQGLSGLAWIAWDENPVGGDSARAFERLLHKFPDSPLAAEAAMMRGRTLQKQGKLEAALGMYHLVIKQYGDSSHAPTAMLAAATIHDSLDQDRQAEPLLRRLQEQHPDYKSDAVMYQLAWVLVDLDQADKADDLFERIHARMPRSAYWADATYRLADRAARAKDAQRADRLAAAIVDADSPARITAHALYLRGQLAAKELRWSDVVRWMERLVQQFSASPLRLPARYWLAEAHYRLRHYEQAGELFTQLESDTKGRGDSWLAMISLRRAQVLAQRRQWDAAHEIAQTIPQRFPAFDRQYEVDYLLGRYHASRAELELARQAYQRVLQSPRGARTETAAMAQWMIGETHFLQKQYDKAIKAYYRVETLYDYPRWQAAALLQAGKCHEMTGQWEEAVRSYLQVLDQYSETPVAAKATQRLSVARQRAEIAKTR